MTIEADAFDGCKSLKAVYYLGTWEDWDRVSVDFESDPILASEMYFYSEGEPERAGMYWRYADGEAKAWTK